MLAYMASNLFLHTGSLEIGISDGKMGSHLIQSLRCDDANAQLELGLSKPQPELAPDGVPGPLAEQGRHFRAAVATGEGGLVGVIWALLRSLGLELLDLLLELLDFGLGGLELVGHVGQLSALSWLLFVARCQAAKMADLEKEELMTPLRKFFSIQPLTAPME